jgi:hypothetical protein
MAASKIRVTSGLRRRRASGGNEVMQRLEIVYRFRRPADFPGFFHVGFGSSRVVPQLSTHATTSSWGITRPALADSKPFLMALICH